MTPSPANCPNDSSKKNIGKPANTNIKKYGMRKAPRIKLTRLGVRTVVLV